MRLLIFTLISLSIIFNIYAQDTLTVYFLHGSKPKRAYKDTEQKWFGGKLGGHVGISVNDSEILNFLPTKGGSLFNKKEFESKFVLSSESNFWNILGYVDSVTSTIIKIPISENQKTKFEIIKNNYLNNSPYDYALLGYRCGSSSYEILAQIHVLKPMTNKKTIYRIFYPRRLRKRLVKHSNYSISITQGSTKRKWEE